MKQLTKKQLKIMLQTSEASDYIEPIKADGEEFNLTVRRYISIDDQAAIVRDVVDAIIGDDYYHPEYLDAVFAKAVIGAYSNIDIGMVDNKLLSDILYSVADTASTQEGLLSIYEYICMHVSERQLNSMHDSVEKLITYRREQQTNTQKILLEQTRDSITAAVNTMNEIASMTSESLNGIDPEIIKSAVSQLNKKKMLQTEADKNTSDGAE